jgi:hypothetical protein
MMASDLEYLISLYFNSDDAFEQKHLDELSAWILQSPENGWRFARAAFLNRTIHDSLASNNAIRKGFLRPEEPDVQDRLFWQTLAEEERSAPAIEMTQPNPPPELIQKVVYLPREKRKITLFQILPLVISAAAMLFIVLFVKLVPEKRYNVEVATLVDQVNAVWAKPETSPQTGSRLWSDEGPLHLQKGVVSVRYDDGIDVLIEGPAVFEVRQSEVFLEYGRLYSHVAQTGLGFVVRTPTSNFIDMGTEFGIHADINGSSQLHVTKGKVQLFAGSERRDKLSQMVTADTAVSYNANAHKISSIPFEKHHFVSQIDSKTNAVLRGYANRYEAAVAETRPTAWYRFEKGQDAMGYDEISDTVTSCDFSGPVAFADGPAIDSEPGNKSLYLSGTADSGVFLSDKTVMLSGGKALSISLWIQPEAGMTEPQNIICYTDHQKRTNSLRTNQLYLTADNRAVFRLYNIYGTDISAPFKGWTLEAREQSRGLRIIADDPLPFNQWFHLTACFSDTKMEFYINGQLCETKPIPVRTEYHDGGYWGIGCMTGVSGADLMGKLYNYKGYVDEISFYDRPLTAQEVQSLYGATRPFYQ